jgi:hypothetical protein
MRRFALASLLAFAGCAGIVGIEDDYPLPALAVDAGTDAAEDVTVFPDAVTDPTAESPVPGELETTPAPCTKAIVTGAEGQIYEDVLPTAVEAEAVLAMHTAGVVSGCESSPSLFCPGCLLSRGVLAKWLVLASRTVLVIKDSPTFTDVPKNHPYYDYVETAFANGFVDGFPDGSYKPQDALSRGSTAVILTKAAALPVPTPLPDTFADVAPGQWWHESIEALYAACVTTGCNASGPQFCPDKLITRRGAVVMVARAFELITPTCTVDP